MSEPITNNREIQQAFVEYDRRVILNNVIIGCLIGIVLMPLGTLLDYKVDTDHWPFFLKLRLLCSLLIGLFWLVVMTPFGHKHPRKLGVLLAIIPAFFMSWMIYATKGSESTYYAGLNLVLLVVGFVLHWTFVESLAVVGVTMLMYVGACGLHGDISWKSLFNNLYFLNLTGVIIVIGSYFQNKTRFREFAFRYELDKSKHALETSNTKLAEQNIALNRANREIKETEMQLVQSEKLASLGRMSAGMIHEINNPLNFATTGLFTLRKKGKYLAPEQQAGYAEILKDVEEGVNRVKTIVSDLRMFTHPDTEQRDHVAVGEVVTAALRFLNDECEEKVQFKVELAANQTIWGNKNILIHVLTNLLQNSLDALKTKTFTGEKPAVRIAGRMENGVSFLTVHDNGPGIAAEHLDKIYDPFFTTKDVGEGMGLGLSICYRIVREAKGKISVKTEPGKFCEFTMEFPATETPPATN